MTRKHAWKRNFRVSEMSPGTQLRKQRPNLTQVEQLCRLNWTQKDEGNSISQSKWSHYIVYFLKQRKYKVWQWNDHAWEISCFKLLYNSILSPVWVGLSLVESVSTLILVKPGNFLKISSYYSRISSKNIGKYEIRTPLCKSRIRGSPILTHTHQDLLRQ